MTWTLRLTVPPAPGGLPTNHATRHLPEPRGPRPTTCWHLPGPPIPKKPPATLLPCLPGPQEVSLVSVQPREPPDCSWDLDQGLAWVPGDQGSLRLGLSRTLGIRGSSRHDFPASGHLAETPSLNGPSCGPAGSQGHSDAQPDPSPAHGGPQWRPRCHKQPRRPPQRKPRPPCTAMGATSRPRVHPCDPHRDPHRADPPLKAGPGVLSTWACLTLPPSAACSSTSPRSSAGTRSHLHEEAPTTPPQARGHQGGPGPSFPGRGPGCVWQ